MLISRRSRFSFTPTPCKAVGTEVSQHGACSRAFHLILWIFLVKKAPSGLPTSRTHLRLGHPVPGQLHHGEVAFPQRPLDVVEADSQRPLLGWLGGGQGGVLRHDHHGSGGRRPKAPPTVRTAAAWAPRRAPHTADRGREEVAAVAAGFSSQPRPLVRGRWRAAVAAPVPGARSPRLCRRAPGV